MVGRKKENIRIVVKDIQIACKNVQIYVYIYIYHKDSGLSSLRGASLSRLILRPQYYRDPLVRNMSLPH